MSGFAHRKIDWNIRNITKCNRIYYNRFCSSNTINYRFINNIWFINITNIK